MTEPTVEAGARTSSRPSATRVGRAGDPRPRRRGGPLRRRREPALTDLAPGGPAGERVAIAGRTGAGKSTLALAAAGFIPRVVRAKLSGTATLGDLALGTAGGRALLGRVGIVFSTPANQLSASKLTVREELAFGLENIGLPRDEMDGRIDAVLGRLGIAHLAEREPFALSGGEQQRVAIASIVDDGHAAARPRRADRPARPGRDGGGRRPPRGLARSGPTILCAEHDPIVLGRLDRCLVLDAGRPIVIDDARRGAWPRARRRSGCGRRPSSGWPRRPAWPPAAAFDEAAIAGGARAAQRLGAAARRRPAGGPRRRLDAGARTRPPVRIDVEGLSHRYPDGHRGRAGRVA